MKDALSEMVEATSVEAIAGTPLPLEPTGAAPWWGAADLAAVALGGAIGAVIRFAMSHFAATHWPRHAHLATLLINAIGSLLLGVVAAWMLTRPWPMWAQRGIAIGMLGAFTTYSTFAVEAVKLHADERLSTAVWYVIATTVVCVLLAGLGYWLGSRMTGTGS